MKWSATYSRPPGDTNPPRAAPPLAATATATAPAATTIRTNTTTAVPRLATMTIQKIITRHPSGKASHRHSPESAAGSTGPSKKITTHRTLPNPRAGLFMDAVLGNIIFIQAVGILGGGYIIRMRPIFLTAVAGRRIWRRLMECSDRAKNPEEEKTNVILIPVWTSIYHCHHQMQIWAWRIPQVPKMQNLMSEQRIKDEKWCPTSTTSTKWSMIKVPT